MAIYWYFLAAMSVHYIYLLVALHAHHLPNLHVQRVFFFSFLLFKFFFISESGREHVCVLLASFASSFPSEYLSLRIYLCWVFVF